MNRLLSKIGNIKNGRILYSFLVNRIKFSPPVSRFLTKSIRTVLLLPQVSRRKIKALFLLRIDSPVSISSQDGFALFSCEDFPGAKELMRSAEQILNKSELESGSSGHSKFGKGKKWRRNILTGEDLVRHPELLRYLSSKKMLATVSRYLGTFPQIGDVQMWISEKNDQNESSQLFHIDQEDYSQIKLFIYLNDVGPDMGPFTFIKARALKSIFKSSPLPFSRQQDDFIKKEAGGSNLVEVCGKKGTAAFVDTSRCYHFGSRTRCGRRIALMVQYISLNCIREPNVSVMTPSIRDRIRKQGDSSEFSDLNVLL